MSQAGLGAGPFSTGPGACSGRVWSLAQLGWRGRTRPGKFGSGRCGLTMTPGSGRPGTRGEGGEAGPSPSPGASARQRPTAGCYLPPPLLCKRPGASEARCSARARHPPLTASESGERRPARGPGARAEKRQAGWQADNAARAELRCASGAERRARGRVCVCACQSTLTGRNPLARLRPRHRPLPPPIERFEHKGPRLAPPAAWAQRAGQDQTGIRAWGARVRGGAIPPCWGTRLKPA